MGAAGGNRHGQLVGPGAQRRLGAPQIGHQRHHGHAGLAHGIGDHLRGIRHLRQQPRRHERGHFDFPHARGDQRVDPPELGLGRHGGLHRLQPVAGPDFADQDVGLY
ncbi:hypothetical protein D9M68_764270 [compost metagenome]